MLLLLLTGFFADFSPLFYHSSISVIRQQSRLMVGFTALGPINHRKTHNEALLSWMNRSGSVPLLVKLACCLFACLIGE